MASKFFGDTASLAALLSSVDQSTHAGSSRTFTKRKIDEDEFMSDEDYAKSIPLLKSRRNDDTESFIPCVADDPFPKGGTSLPEIDASFHQTQEVGRFNAARVSRGNDQCWPDVHVVKAFSSALRSDQGNDANEPSIRDSFVPSDEPGHLPKGDSSVLEVGSDRTDETRFLGATSREIDEDCENLPNSDNIKVSCAASFCLNSWETMEPFLSNFTNGETVEAASFLTNAEDGQENVNIGVVGTVGNYPFSVSTSEFTFSSDTEADDWWSDVLVSGRDSLDDETFEVSVSTKLHFFVKTFPHSQTIVLHANYSDTVESIQGEIERRTQIPTCEQRLIYAGRQLRLGQTLAQCGIQKDSELHLVGRIRSTCNHKPWQLAGEITSSIYRMISGQQGLSYQQTSVPTLVSKFIKLCPPGNVGSIEHRRVLQYSRVPSALCALYMSPIVGNKLCAAECIQLFCSPVKDMLIVYSSVLLDICKQLSCIANHSNLYASCRHAFALSLEVIGDAHNSEHLDNVDPCTMMENLIIYINELVLTVDLNDLLEPVLELSDVGDLLAFVRPLRHAISTFAGTRTISVQQLGDSNTVKKSHRTLRTVQSGLCYLLRNMEGILNKNQSTGIRKMSDRNAQKILLLLREFDHLSKIFESEAEFFYLLLKSNRLMISSLILSIKQGNDHLWILEYQDVLDLDAIEHLLFAMFPDMDDDQEYPNEMLIDRSKLLEFSFEYISQSCPKNLKQEILIEFKDEKATGPGVVREWFHLVCSEIFDPRRPLFMACPNDKRKFFPNPASGVDPMHLEYFLFSGRVIAMALMHRVKVNVVFARSFLRNLSGKHITLEDIKDEEPAFYSSCKQLLEMEAEILDSGELGLSFSVEYDDIDSRKSAELCHGGKNINVNSNNRQRFVDLLIDHRFSKRVSRQVEHFLQGFSDILTTPKLSSIFFKFSDQGLLEKMLHGGNEDISVNEWKAHTQYNGYLESDCQIIWFWQVVETMSMEQQKLLLQFWTSWYRLPESGFAGLDSKLQIYKHNCSLDHLPSSHTCFYQFMLPPYPSFSIMKKRLHLICQPHISSSFGES